MKVFLSWSGDASKECATALSEWLPLIFPDVAFWLSTRDIHAGQNWGSELDSQLASTSFGVLCLVPANLFAPWLLFEAGALSKAVTSSSRVVPYCLGFEPQDVQGPLSRFQGTAANKSGTRKLVESINSLLENRRRETLLDQLFEKLWPDLQSQLEKIPTATVSGPSVVRVQRILFASTVEFEKLDASEDLGILEKHYPELITQMRNASLADLRDTLARQRFDIVHLLGYVEPRTGDFVFSKEERLPAQGLLKLLERSGTSLLFLATCDSLTLGAILSRSMSVIAASDNVESQAMIQWERCFYGFLATRISLAQSYDLAQATAHLPMRLLIRSDSVFVPSERNGAQIRTT